MYGKLLQHLREQRSRQTNFFQFSENDHQGVTDGNSESLNSKDLTKYAYGVAKGMEFIVSKGVRILRLSCMYVWRGIIGLNFILFFRR